MADVVLRCEGLVKRYGARVAVDGLGFAIEAGECYGMLGPNGAGKTTTISLVCGLLEADAGEIVVDGRRMDGRAADVKAAVGYVPQEIALYPALSARDNLRFFGRLYGLRAAGLAARVDEALAVVGLADRARDRIDTYSGGMKRRANIAAALLHRPHLLVLDEPTVGVDPQSRNAILETVADLAGEGMAVLYASHYMEEVERICDRVAIVDQGHLVAEGTPRELIALVGGRGRVELSARGRLDELARACLTVHGVDEVTVTGDGVHVIGRDPAHLLPRLLEAAEGAGAEVTSVNLAEPDLEDVFLHLTGKALRD